MDSEEVLIFLAGVAVGMAAMYLALKVINPQPTIYNQNKVLEIVRDKEGRIAQILEVQR